MFDKLLSPETIEETLRIVQNEFLLGIWETLYVTVIATALAIVIGLPLGVLLVAGEKNGVLPLPRPVMQVLNVVINLLRSVPFLILMIMAFPLARLIVGTAVGTVASIVPLVIAAFPFVARLVESSLREVNPNIIEMAQSMGASPFQIIMKVMIPECRLCFPILRLRLRQFLVILPWAALSAEADWERSPSITDITVICTW